MRSAIVTEADFTNADLRSANLSGAKGCLSAKFDNTNLRGTNLSYTGLDKVDLGKAGAKVDDNTKGLKIHVLSFDI
jgi:uncharacterized protein YjbI with pentapeptide repeats